MPLDVYAMLMDQSIIATPINKNSKKRKLNQFMSGIPITDSDSDRKKIKKVKIDPVA